MILCLTGFPGSGKSTAAQIFAENGFEVREMSAIIKDEMAKRKLEINTESIEEFANKMKAEHGKGIFAEMMGKRLKDADGNILVVGFRSIAEFETVERTVGADLPLIVLTVPSEMRFKRLSERVSLPVKSKEKFMMRDSSNIHMGILELLKRADFLVSNTGSKKELTESIEELIRKIKEA